MTQDLRVALTTGLNDRLVGPLRRTINEVEKNLKQLEKGLEGVNRTGSKASKAVSSELEKVAAAGAKADRTLSGMRGPARAARDAADLARNTEQALRLVERLRTAYSATGGMLRGVTTGVAAFQAAKYVVGAPMQQQRTYSRQLADAANTAFADRDVAGRIGGMRELDTTVVRSLRAGGGTREDVLAALNEMMASGVVSAAQAQSVLPTVARYATAGNASAQDLSLIVVRALQSGFKEADIPKMLDMALVAGQKGGFELKDMAKWLPKLLAAGATAGMNGMDGYARILASAQGSVTTAGSKDEAGNNLLNLLLKINSNDTAQDAKKLGIDLAGSLAAARGKGTNTLDAFVNLVDQVAGRDQRMVALRRQAASAGTSQERASTLSAQADILQGSAIGKIVQDRQALLSLVAELNKREYIADVKGAVMGANGQYGASNFGLISQTADFRIQQQANEKLIALDGPMGVANEALGKLAEVATTVYEKYPGFGAAVETAKVAIYGLAAAAGAAGLAQLASVGKLGMAAAGAAGGSGAAGAAVRAAAAGAGAGGGSLSVATSGGALAVGGAATLAGTGMLAGGAVLAGGVLMSEGLSSQAGLRMRIDSRQARINELNELATLERSNSGSAGSIERLQAEISKLTEDRNSLASRLVGIDEVARELRALQNRPVQVHIDGREVASSVNERNTWLARRQ